MEAGVTQVVLAVSYRAQEMEQELSTYAEKVSADPLKTRPAFSFWSLIDYMWNYFRWESL